jgi:hypothetical protein
MKKTILVIGTVVMLFSAVSAMNAPAIKIDITTGGKLDGTSGDFVFVNGTLKNASKKDVQDITTYLSLVNLDTKMPVDLEDWSAERGLFIGTINAGQLFPLSWKIHFVQAGSYALTLIADVAGDDRPVVSRMTYFNVKKKLNLNPGNVLPVALGEPIFIVLIFLVIGYIRRSKK